MVGRAHLLARQYEMSAHVLLFARGIVCDLPCKAVITSRTEFCGNFCPRQTQFKVKRIQSCQSAFGTRPWIGVHCPPIHPLLPR